MTTGHRKNPKNTVKEVRKPFLKGSPIDSNTPRSSLVFFGMMLIIIFVSFIACTSAAFGNHILRVILNSLVVLIVLYILYNKGANHGADAVSRGEILFQKKENGQEFSDSEHKVCYHPLKGFLTGLIGSVPFLIVAVLLALNTQEVMTGSGTIPSWLQTYTRRADVGNALVQYMNPEGMTFTEYLRVAVRIMILPFVNIAGSSNKAGLLLVERLSPLILLLPAASYGFGYMTGKKIRTRIHTAISENNRKRINREKKARMKRMGADFGRKPEQLN